MKDTYRSQAEADMDYALQQQLVAALNAASNSLRLDECRAWTIFGTHGHIYTWGDAKSWLIYAAPGQSEPFLGGTKNAWTRAKKRLGFCEVTQDGDDEGCLRLFALPADDQAEIIRDILGIRKSPGFSPEDIERRTERIKAAVFSRKKRTGAVPDGLAA